MFKKLLLVSSVAAVSLFASGHNVLSTDKSGELQKNITKAIDKEKAQADRMNQVFNASADKRVLMAALRNLAEALFDLKKQDKVAALKKLEMAQENLSKIKAEIVPAQADLFILEFRGTINQAESLLKDAKAMVDAGNYQAASDLLNILKDEMDIREVDVNVAYLQKKLTKIIEEVKANKLEEAFKDLALLYKDPRGVIKIVARYPLGVIKASYLLEQARILNQMGEKDKIKKIVPLIEETKKQLKLDYTLGYFYPKKLREDYKKLMAMLDKLEATAKAGKVSSNYTKVTNMMEKFKEHSINKQKNPKFQVIQQPQR